MQCSSWPGRSRLRSDSTIQPHIWRTCHRQRNLNSLACPRGDATFRKLPCFPPPGQPCALTSFRGFVPGLSTDCPCGGTAPRITRVGVGTNMSQLALATCELIHYYPDCAPRRIDEVLE